MASFRVAGEKMMEAEELWCTDFTSDRVYCCGSSGNVYWLNRCTWQQEGCVCAHSRSANTLRCLSDTVIASGGDDACIRVRVQRSDHHL